MINNPQGGIEYHEQLASSWSDLYDRPGFRARMQMFEKLIGRHVQPGSHWLDAGCGSGVLTRSLASHGARVLAVDASAAMVAEATTNLQAEIAAGKAEVDKIDSVEDLSAIDGQFDGVLCSSVLEYLRLPDLALEQFRSKLRPGGILILSAPNAFSLVRNSQKLLRGLGKIARKDIAAYLAVSISDFSKGGLQRQIERSGFTCIDHCLFDPLLPEILASRCGSLHIVTAASDLPPEPPIRAGGALGARRNCASL